ncbi:inositol-tetrakisphosphate 1-kinase [Spinellus fusiger]|nr:inositol-tetrakisphosphate 1-kinase [Spinellus fusiger]
MDAWENIEKVLDRSRLYLCLKQYSERGTEREPLFYVPNSTILNSFDAWSEEEIHFPVICKRSVACSSTASHQMVIIPSKEDMYLVHGYGKEEPVILQEFISHDGTLIKVYVLQDKIYAKTRPSFKNELTDSALYFDSQTMPKSFAVAIDPTNDLSKVLRVNGTNTPQLQEQPFLDYDRLKKMADDLRIELGLTFFGFDVLIESATLKPYIVDVNYFPSFSNVPNFQSIFLSILLQENK